MPAQMEVEENPSILEFFFYIVEKVGQNFPQEICGVLCRIFSDSEDDLLGWFFTPENIDQLKSLLHQYIQKVGNPGDFIAKITNGDENKAAKRNNIRKFVIMLLDICDKLNMNTDFYRKKHDTMSVK